MKCRYCGCTEERACRIPVDLDGSLELEPAGDGILNRASLNFIPCSWLIPNVCTSPACVEKCYLALRIADDGALELIA